MRRIDWPSIGEWVFIFTFCISYAIIANIQSRLAPVDGSIASEVRLRVSFELDRLNARYDCEDQAIKAHKNETTLIWIWYENKQTHEYWCGFLDPDKLTRERARELRPHIEVLNSDRSIRRITERESDKHIGRQGDLP